MVVHHVLVRVERHVVRRVELRAAWRVPMLGLARREGGRRRLRKGLIVVSVRGVGRAEGHLAKIEHLPHVLSLPARGARVLQR